MILNLLSKIFGTNIYIILCISTLRDLHISSFRRSSFLRKINYPKLKIIEIDEASVF